MRRGSALPLLIAIGLGAISIGMFNVVFNLYVLAAGRTQAELGLTLSSGTLGAAIAVLPAGMAGDAWGRRPALLVAGGVAAVTTFAQCSVTDLVPLVCFGALSGAAGASLSVAAIPALVESARPGGAATLLTIAGAIGVAGTTVGAAVAGWLPDRLAPLFGPVLGVGGASGDLERYRLTLYGGLALAGVAVIPVLIWFRDGVHPSGLRPAWTSLRSGLALRGVGAPYLGAELLLGAGAGWVIPYLNIYLTRDRGLSLATYGVVAAGGSLSLAATMALVPFVARRLGMPATVALGQLLSLPLLAVLAFGRAAWLLATAYGLRVALMDGGGAAAQGWVTERMPSAQRGVYSSLALIAFQLPWSLTSVAGGWLQGRIGYGPLFLLTGLWYVPAALLFWRAYRSVR